MARPAKLPDTAEHNRLWKAMPLADRRTVLRQIRRGEVAANRKQARVAVGVARQQQRYWRLAWLFGPAIALLFAGRSTLELVLSAVLGTLVMGVLSWRSHRKAQQAEVLNLDLLGIPRDGPG